MRNELRIHHLILLALTTSELINGLGGAELHEVLG